MNDDIKNLWKIHTELLSNLKGKAITIDETEESGSIEDRIFQHRQHVVDTTNELIQRNLRLLGWTHKDDVKKDGSKIFKDVVEERIRLFKALHKTLPTHIFAGAATTAVYINPELSSGDRYRHHLGIMAGRVRFCGLILCKKEMAGFELYDEVNGITMD